MTVTGYVREDLAITRPGESRTGVQAGRAWIESAADRIARLTWCWPALLAFVLGLYQLGRPELWRDELASWSFASRPVPSLIASARHTGATQLAYYLLLHGWIAAFGDSAVAMRTLSIIAMAAAAACVALVGRRLAGARAGLTAGLVFALVPSVSRFAQEIRFYALAVLVATLATLLLLRALDRPSGPRWAAYAASLALLGYVELVALSVLAGHIAGAVLRLWYDHDRRQLRFLAAVAAGLAACLPLALAGAAQARDQIGWIAQPGLDLADLSSFGPNLFYSTGVAAALIILGVLAWAVAGREAAFMTALAVGPVAVVWLASQGTYSYFFPRYLLFTVAAWAILAGIGLSRLDVRVAAAAVLAVAILGAGGQQAIRAPGAHSWSSYPAGSGRSYPDYAAAASFIGPRARPGDGAVYQGGKHGQNFMMIGDGISYYLAMDMPNGVAFPHQLFVARSAAEAGTLYPQSCRHPAACLGAEPRIWVVGNRHQGNPYRAVTPAQAAVLRPRYRLSLVKHVRGLTVFLLTRAAGA